MHVFTLTEKLAFGASGIATLLCWVSLWRSSSKMSYKIILTLLAGLPFFGPVFFLIISRIPSVQPLEQQQTESVFTEPTAAQSMLYRTDPDSIERQLRGGSE